MREASEVLLLLHESFRASRHIRGLWLFENLGKSLCVDKTKVFILFIYFFFAITLGSCWITKENVGTDTTL